MRLIFDARPIAQQYTGLGRYTASLLRALLASADKPNLEIDVLLNQNEDWASNAHFQRITPFVESGRCTLHYLDAPAISLKQQWTVPAWVNRRGGDIYFYPHFDVPLMVRVPTVFVVHDLIPLIVSGYVQRMAWAKKIYFRRMIQLGIRAANRCVAVSQTTRKDILQLVGDRYAAKIDVAYEGPVLDASPSSSNALTELGIAGSHLLYVGDRRPHKNIRRVIDLFSLLRDDYGYAGKLVLAGSTRNFGFDVEAYIADRVDIIIPGNISDEQLQALYADTDALLFLSEYEGFGLPVVEAAHFGRKMVLSDGGSLVEVAPPTACIIPRSQSVEEAAPIVSRYLAEPTEPYPQSYLEKFRWEQVVRVIFPDAFR